MNPLIEQSQQEFLDKCRRQTNGYLHYFIKIRVLIDMIDEKNKKIIELENENEKLRKEYEDL